MARLLDERCVPVRSETDIVVARQLGRELAASLGFSHTERTFISTAISEVARNIVVHAGSGEVILQIVQEDRRRGIVVVAADRGPGIPDVARAMRPGYSTARSLGLGLSGAKNLMDEFDLQSTVGKGTTVTMKKWERSGGAPVPGEAA